MNQTTDLTLLRDALAVAADHLVQYQQYSNEMCAIGRGLYVSSPYREETAGRLILRALDSLMTRDVDTYTRNCADALRLHIAAAKVA